MRKDSFIWSDNWWIENEAAWFISGEYNALLQLDLTTSQCSFVADLPSSQMNKMRLNPRCIKYGNEIFCMPDVGNSILVYQPNTLKFYEIVINNPDNERLSIANFWRMNEKIFAVSIGLGKIIEIDMVEKKIANYYRLTKKPEERISLSVMVDNSIYSSSAVSNQVYVFDLESKSTKVLTISDVEGGFRTICFDGENFWLSGYRKEIYVWNKENNTAKIIKNFPKEFGIYNFKNPSEWMIDYNTALYELPAFIDSVAIGQYVWFIPFRTNKIIYVDKDTYEINAFEIAEEDETEASLVLNSLKHKYLVQYILNNRFIGLYSLKNNCIIQIDAFEQKKEWKEFFWDKKSLLRMEQLCIGKKLFFSENKNIEREIYMTKLKGLYVNDDRKDIKSVGYMIYKRIMC